MWKSSHALQGSPQFTIATRKLDDGRWEASIPTQPSITPQTAATETDAVLSIKREIYGATMRGDVSGL